MNANRPHGHRRGEGEHKPAPHESHHPHHHDAHAHIHHRPARKWGFGRASRFVFCKRGGRISSLKCCGLGFAALASLYLVVVTGLLPVDIGGPLVKSALQEKLGKGHKVAVGETRLEQDASGQPVLRVHGITIRGAGGEVVATAPRADVGLDSGILLGNFRAKRIDLVEAEMTLRINEDGQIDMSAGRKPKLLKPGPADAPANAPAVSSAQPAKSPEASPSAPLVYPELAAWLGRLEESGLDGISLAEVGLKQGTLVVENAKTGRRWIFAKH